MALVTIVLDDERWGGMPEADALDCIMTDLEENGPRPGNGVQVVSVAFGAPATVDHLPTEEERAAWRREYDELRAPIRATRLAEKEAKRARILERRRERRRELRLQAAQKAA
ncbi:hypothetical protein FBZ83_11968 [Azospirillum brasilense]|uniref:Uncharacterized protein n=1 Tax=Azospirillum brasilense TaxID=192 RepID=A0A560BUW4_AZOBR|nr:hypothetical protein [Azospirillum brasilense]TWA76417.1 hypothetical protein FBZ83_11968 [Azospirillum brasilense]